MVLRFHQDVIDLQPAAVVILAGVNDVQGFLQQEQLEQIEAHYAAMAEMAGQHHIRVVFGSLLPVNNYTEQARAVLRERDPAKLRALDQWLQAFCRAHGYGYADYYAALVDRQGLMTAGLTQDGVHPLDAGYARMAPIAAAAIARALAAPPQR
jgi:lysophospholipase L1-like esterase